MSKKNSQDNNSSFKMNSFNEKQIVQGHICKFIRKAKNHHQDKGIICFPEQTYGNSLESPDQFKGQNTIVLQNGYEYRHQNKPQFKYYSQKRYFSIDGSTNQEQSRQIHYQDPQNAVKFHRKKGKLTEFMDKNGWMNKTIKMMGYQRDSQARQFSNRDRVKKISLLKQKVNFENKSAIRPNTKGQYFRTLGTLTSRKMKIRQRRNDEADKFSHSIQPRNIQTSHKIVSKLDRESIEQKVLHSARKWSPSKDAKSKCQQFSKTFYGTSRLNKFQNQIQTKNHQRQYSWRQDYEQTLQDWYRTTCSSKWVYTKKMQDEQLQGNQLQQQLKC